MQTETMGTRAGKFWRDITDGVALQQLWQQFQSDARASYRLYSRGIDHARRENETRWQRFKRVARGLFWAMVLKLSPARRVLFLIALVLLVFPGFDVHVGNVDVQEPNLAFFGAILLVILFALELADRVTMKRDLEIAKEIQSWLMPVAAPQVTGIEIAFATRPANTVAGDYYDAFLRPATAGCPGNDQRLMIVVADVAGKSVPAALLMATLRASLRTLANVCSDVVELIERLNRYSCEQNASGQRFTTIFIAEFDPLSRRLTYINAGHNWPVLTRASGNIERLQTGGLPIGVMASARYESGECILNAGDVLIIFTDGLIEAENDKEEEYGEGRMLATLKSKPGTSASDLLHSLMASADRFVGTAPQHDDITCLVLRNSAGPTPEALSATTRSPSVSYPR